MDLFFDITIMTLLLVTIVYAIRLNGKLNLIRENKLEIKANIDAFYNATEKATKVVSELQRQGKDLCLEIDQKVSRARQAADELELILRRVKKTVLQHDDARLAGEGFFEQSQQKPVQSIREREIEQRLMSGLSQVRSNPSVNSQPKFADTASRIERSNNKARFDEKFVSLSEQELLKAMRDREFKQALMG